MGRPPGLRLHLEGSSALLEHRWPQPPHCLVDRAAGAGHRMNPLQVARHRAQNRYRRLALAETAAEGPLQPRQVAARRRQRPVVEDEKCRIADAAIDIPPGDLTDTREQTTLTNRRDAVREQV